MVNCKLIHLCCYETARAAITKILGRICYNTFAFTYNCKQTFYLMKSNKSYLRIRLADESLALKCQHLHQTLENMRETANGVICRIDLVGTN
jgi:hypothetical protein